MTSAPAPSPRPPENPPERTATGEFRAIVEPMLAAHDNKLTVRSVFVAVGAVVVGTVAALVFVDNRVAAQVDAGVRVQVAEQKAQDARLTTLEQRFDRYESRHDAQMNLALDALRVPVSSRPPPLVTDGGVR